MKFFNGIGDETERKTDARLKKTNGDNGEK
jgi:hypothetical protein